MFERIAILLSAFMAAVAMFGTWFPETAARLGDRYIYGKPILHIEVLDPRPHPDGLAVTYSFYKNRCDFVEVVWADQAGDPRRVEFPKDTGGYEVPEEYIDRPEGWQTVPVAVLPGIVALEGTRGLARHRCGSGDYERIVETQMYP